MNTINNAKVREINDSIIATQNAGLRFVLNVANKKCDLDYKILSIFEKKWKNIKGDLKTWFSNQAIYKLGNIQTLAVQSDTWIVHMLCQDENKKTDKNSLAKCLKSVSDLAKYEQASVHISSKLFEDIPELKECIDSNFIKKGISVYLYKD